MVGIVLVGLGVVYAGFACADLAAVFRAPSSQKPTWALRPTFWKALCFGLRSPFKRFVGAYKSLALKQRRLLIRIVTLVLAASALGVVNVRGSPQN